MEARCCGRTWISITSSRANNWSSACDGLEASGYTPERYPPRSAAFRVAERRMDHHNREIRYERAIGEVGVVVELHWDVFPRREPTPWTPGTYAHDISRCTARVIRTPKHLCDFRDWVACHPNFDWDAYHALARRQQLTRVAQAAPARPWRDRGHRRRRARVARNVACNVACNVDRSHRRPSALRAFAATLADLRRFHRLRMTLLDTRAARCKYALRLLQPPGDTTWTARWRHLASRLDVAK